MLHTVSHRGRLPVALLAAMLLAALLAPAAASAQTRRSHLERSCDVRANITYGRLLECVSAESVTEHLEAFQQIADENDDNRAAGTPGYEASVDYIVDLTTAAGYDVTTQDFEFPYFEITEDGAFSQDDPTPTEYVDQTDFDVATYSGSGDVDSAPVVPVDLNLDGDRANSSGCEEADFDGFPEGAIALLQRGSCSFAIKAANAEAAGAVGVIIFNQGNEDPVDDRFGLLLPTLGAPGSTIPVFGTTFAIGQELANATDATVSLSVETDSEVRTGTNVFAETPWGDPDNVVMAGAHLDSVPEGPGINDNASGSAAILDIALKMDRVDTPNKIRYAWWGAEEFGLLGSEYYVGELLQDDVDDIALYLNFDMVGSPNFVRFVYDGDGDAFGTEGPDGSDDIEHFFTDYFASQGLASEPTAFTGRSDYGPFIAAGVDIPSGGLFTGAEGVKTEEQAEIYGGEAGEWYDPCYHQACDTIDNVSAEVLGQNVDAIAAAILRYGFSTEDINGVEGRKVPGRALWRGDRPAPVPGAGAGATAGGGHTHSHGDDA